MKVMALVGTAGRADMDALVAAIVPTAPAIVPTAPTNDSWDDRTFGFLQDPIDPIEEDLIRWAERIRLAAIVTPEPDAIRAEVQRMAARLRALFPELTVVRAHFMARDMVIASLQS